MTEIFNWLLLPWRVKTLHSTGFTEGVFGLVSIKSVGGQILLAL